MEHRKIVITNLALEHRLHRIRLGYDESDSPEPCGVRSDDLITLISTGPSSPGLNTDGDSDFKLQHSHGGACSKAPAARKGREMWGSIEGGEKKRSQQGWPVGMDENERCFERRDTKSSEHPKDGLVPSLVGKVAYFIMLLYVYLLLLLLFHRKIYVR